MEKNKINLSPDKEDDLNFKSSSRASQEFIDACSAARKAWHGTNLLSISKPKIIKRVKLAMVEDDAIQLRGLLLEVMGPVSPINPKDAMGPSTMGHREMAGIICLAAMRIACACRKPGDVVSMELVKRLLLSWIDFGEFQMDADTYCEEVENTKDTARKMALVFSSVKYPDRVRLAVVAPLAPALESLIVIAALSESMLMILSQTQERVQQLQVSADEFVANATET